MPFTQQTDSPTFLSGVADALGFNSGERESGPETIAKWAQSADKWLDEEAPWWLNAVTYALPGIGTARAVGDIVDNWNDGDSSNDLAMAGDVALMLASLIPGAGGIYSGLTKGAIKAGSKVAKGAKGVKVAGKEGEEAAKILKNTGYLDDANRPALSEIMERINKGEDALAGPSKYSYSDGFLRRTDRNADLSGKTKLVEEGRESVKASKLADQAAETELRDARAVNIPDPIEQERLARQAADEAFETSNKSLSEAYALAEQQAKQAQLADRGVARASSKAEKAASTAKRQQLIAKQSPNSPAAQSASTIAKFDSREANAALKRAEEAAQQEYDRVLAEAAARRNTGLADAQQTWEQRMAKAATEREAGERALAESEKRISDAVEASRAREGVTSELERLVAQRESALAEAYRAAQKSQLRRDTIANLLLKDRSGKGVLGRSIRQLPYGAAYASLNPYFMGDEYTPYKAWQGSAGQGR